MYVAVGRELSSPSTSVGLSGVRVVATVLLDLVHNLIVNLSSLQVSWITSLSRADFEYCGFVSYE